MYFLGLRPNMAFQVGVGWYGVGLGVICVRSGYRDGSAPTTDFYTSIDTQSMVVYFNPTLVCLIGRQGDDPKQVIMTL